MASGPRGVVPNMLLMSALKIGNPVEELVLVKTDNLTRDSRCFCRHGFHVKSSPILRSLRLDNRPNQGWNLVPRCSVTRELSDVFLPVLTSSIFGCHRLHSPRANSRSSTSLCAFGILAELD
jgi:hypothetical protein